MKVSNIQETGSRNVLSWAIENKADVKNDRALQSIVNDELCYLVTFSDVNLFELFRLIQAYRDKAHIIQEHPVKALDPEMMQKMFPGSYQEKDQDPIPMSEIASTALQAFINLTLQMNADNDAIPTGAFRMFFPMFCRRFDVRIPVSFVDIVDFMKPEEAERVFSENYPDSLTETVVDELTNVNMMLRLMFDQATRHIKYNQQYEKYLQMVKYSPLKTFRGDSLYKCSLISFSKYDNINRADCRCSMFHTNRDQMTEVMRRMSRLNTPLKAEFTVQLPIQYMMMLMNGHNREDLPVMYESSMKDIIDGSIDYRDFITLEEGEDGYEERLTAISDYQVRIADANNIMMNALGILLNMENVEDIGVTNIFSMIPAIYTAKATITVSMDKIGSLMSDSDPVIGAMFRYISNTMEGINDNINRVK